MKTQDIFIAHPKTTEQVDALKAFMLALKINFEVTDSMGYNLDFLQKVENSRQQVKSGQVTRVKQDDLSNFLGV
jgi:hypothetical protein